MAGPIQSAFNQMLGTATAVAVAGKKLNENERQAGEKASAEAKTQKEADDALQKEAQETALEADLVKMGADPESGSSREPHLDRRLRVAHVLRLYLALHELRARHQGLHDALEGLHAVFGLALDKHPAVAKEESKP